MLRNKTLRTISIWTVSIALCVVLSLLLAQQLLAPEVKKLFVSEISKSLLSEVQIDDVQLSLVKDFPYASVRFTGVRIREALRLPTKNNLLTARTISLRFNILDLLRKKYRVKNVMMDGVELGPHIFADGSDNFHFWKPAKTSTAGNFNFEIQRIFIKNLHLRFINDGSRTFADVHAPEFVAKGNFGSSTYNLDLAVDLVIHSIKSQGVSYMADRNVKIWLMMDADSRTGLYNIRKGAIETGKLRLQTSGSLVYSEKQKQINLSVEATGSTFEEMISLVPAKYTKSFDGYKFQGKGDISSTLSGFYGNGQFPAVHVKLGVQNGTITERNSGIGLRNVSASVVYTIYQDGKNETLSISNLKASLGNGFVSGSLAMQGLSSPMLQCNLNASLSLNELQQFMKYEYFTSMSGWLKLNAGFRGTIGDLKHPASADFLHSSFTGSGSIQDANLGLKNYNLPIKGIQALFTFNNNELQLQKFAFKAGRSDFDLHGTLGNLLSWIFVKNESLSVTGSLVSKRFDWDELSGAQQSSGNEYQFRLPPDISISNLNIRSTNFTFGKFSANDITGIAQMNNKILSVADIAMFTCKGRVTGQANINAQAETYSLLQAKARLDNVNVKMLFTEFANFGQDDLKDENLEGVVSSDVIFAGTMKNNLDIDLNSIKTHADIMIENGRLVNYSPMQSLSRFLRVEDLSDIRFATLHNQVDIANQIIYIPAMEIKSSAIDLQLLGTHTFDNGLNYHFTLALADLVASKFKRLNKGYKNQDEFGPVEDDGRGRTKVFVALTGTMDNPIVKYDKQAMREKLAGDMKQQKVELKQAFRKEFNRAGADTTSKSQQFKDKNILNKQEQGKFVIEWDDDKK